MTSGKRTKQQRREAESAPPVNAQTRRASPKVLLAVGAVVLLAVIGVVVGLALSGGGESTPSTAAALPDAAEAQRLFRGIPQSGNVLGSPDAPVTVVEYLDLQCPFCRDFETEAMPDLVSRFVRPGKAKLEARLIAFIGPDSQRGRGAAIAAAEQNRMFELMQLLYSNQGAENSGWLDDDLVRSAAASIPGLDADVLLGSLDTEAARSAAKGFDDQAAADNVTSTPTIMVGKSGQAPQPVTLTSPTDVESVAAAIQAALG